LVEVKQYLSIVVDAGTWSNPTHVLGVENSSCASKTTTGGGSATLIAQPLCSIPSNAIIDNVFVNPKGLHNHSLYAGGALLVSIQTFYFSWMVALFDGVSSGSCPQTYYYGETDILPIWRAFGYDITPDDLNGTNGKFLYFLFTHAAGLAGIYTSYVDAAYVRVIYHLAPPVGLGDGLSFVAFLRNLYKDPLRGKGRVKFDFPPTIMARRGYEKIPCKT